MKKTGFLRFLSIGLALLLAASLLPVSAEEEMAPVEMQRWQGTSLQQAAADTGVTNPAGNPLFTTYEELIGIRQAQGISQNVMVHSMYMPVKYRMGDTLTLTIRIDAGEEVTGTVCWADLIFDAINSGDAYDYKLEIDPDTYRSAEVRTDPVYGYTYREFSMPVNLDDSIFDLDEKSFQLRFYNFGIADITLYRMEVYNDTTQTEVFTANPYALYKAEHLSPVERVVVEAGDNSGIVTYSGPESFPQRPDANTEPYNKYNSDGMNNRALLVETGVPLEAGQYSFVLDFATCYTLIKGDRAILELVRDPDGEEEVVWSHVYTHDEAAERLGSVDYVDIEGMYDQYTVPVEVSAEQAGSTYALRVYATNYSDVYIRSITLNEMVPASQAAVLEVENAIDALPAVGELTLEHRSAVEQARAAYDALTPEQREQVSNLSLLEAAEAEMTRLTEAYETERAAAAQAVVEAIAAIGTVDETNYESKKELIDTAAAALAEYETAYGSDAEAAALITNRQALIDAQAKYDELAAKPAVTYGDINDDGNIDASDALEALQHSVELKTLEGDALTAADLTNDGTVDAADALNILQYSVELIDRFPVQDA